MERIDSIEVILYEFDLYGKSKEGEWYLFELPKYDNNEVKSYLKEHFGGNEPIDIDYHNENLFNLADKTSVYSINTLAKTWQGLTPQQKMGCYRLFKLYGEPMTCQELANMFYQVKERFKNQDIPEDINVAFELKKESEKDYGTNPLVIKLHKFSLEEIDNFCNINQHNYELNERKQSLAFVLTDNRCNYHIPYKEGLLRSFNDLGDPKMMDRIINRLENDLKKFGTNQEDWKYTERQTKYLYDDLKEYRVKAFGKPKTTLKDKVTKSKEKSAKSKTTTKKPKKTVDRSAR